MHCPNQHTLILNAVSQVAPFIIGFQIVCMVKIIQEMKSSDAKASKCHFLISLK